MTQRLAKFLMVAFAVLAATGAMAGTTSASDCGNRIFSSTLAAISQGRDGNWGLFAPGTVSVMTSLFAGARGATRTEFESMVGCLDEKELLAWKARVQNYERSGELKWAGNLWVDQQTPFAPSWLNFASDILRAQPSRILFSDPSTFPVIEKWLIDRAGPMAKGMVTRQDLLAGRVVAAAVVHFQGKWQDRFDPATDGQFLTGAKTKVPVKFLSAERRLPVGTLYGTEFVAVPYGGGAALWLVSTKDLSASRMLLAAIAKNGLDARSEVDRIRVTFPKWSLESAYDLAAVWREKGLQSAFGSSADFSGMGSQRMRLGFLRAKLMMEVDEEGTRATQVDVGGMVAVSARVVREFRFDRPFTWLIVDSRQGTPLLLAGGYIANPSQK